jgi:EAL domain-containing protein (putative c-di-GMP-specific phosphodiesterase class I)
MSSVQPKQELAVQGASPKDAPTQPVRSFATPLCVIVDADNSFRQFISLILHGLGIETVEVADGTALLAIRLPRPPDAIFLDVSLESEDVIKSLMRLSQREFTGAVQLMSARGAAVLEHVRRVGGEHKLNMLPVLKKPFAGEAIVKIMQDLKLGLSLAAATNANLDEAITKDWLEFWYQPIVDLRKKRLVGAEMYARIRHPEAGVILPGGFLTNTSPTSLFKLSENALTTALNVGSTYSKLGINLPISINIPLDVLEKLPVEKLVLDCHPSGKWAGLVIDIPEEQIVADLGLATGLAKKLARLKISIAVDNFGKAYSALAKLKEFPFTQIKLDRQFVVNCGTDTRNAPLCKSMIALAHNFGQCAVATGIENAGDALALVSMGCDYAQGFLLGQPMPETLFASLVRQRTTKAKEKPVPGAPGRNPAATAKTA